MTDAPPPPPPAGDGSPQPRAPDLPPPPPPPPSGEPAATPVSGDAHSGVLPPPPAATMSGGHGPASLPAPGSPVDARRGGRGPLLIVLGVLAAVVIVVVVVLAVAGGGDDDEASIPDPTEEPDGLGDDDALDELARDCHKGSMAACDDLYQQADSGSAYERYGDTCAGRQPESSGRFCTSAFPD